MTAVPSLRDSALPLVVYATGQPTATTDVDWITLTDVKQHLRVALAESEFDAFLVKSMQAAFGYLEARTGLSFSSRAQVAEMAGDCPAVSVLQLEVPHATITSVTEVAEDGVRTVVPSADYEVLYVAKRPYVRLTRATPFAPHAATWVQVAFTTAVEATSPTARRLRALVLMLVKQDFDGMDASRGDCRNSKEFLSAIESVKDLSGMYRAFR